MNLAWPGIVTVVQGINEYGTLVSLHDYQSFPADLSPGRISRLVAARYAVTYASGDDISTHLDQVFAELQNYEIMTGGFINYYAPQGFGGVINCSPYAARSDFYPLRRPQEVWHHGEAMVTTNQDTTGTYTPSDEDVGVDAYYDDESPKTHESHWHLLDPVAGNHALSRLSVACRGRRDMTVWADGRIDGIGRTPRLEYEWSELFNLHAEYGGGTGEPTDPYRIATAADLIALGERPEDYDKHFILTADIDLDPNLPGNKVFHEAVIAQVTLDSDPNSLAVVGAPFRGVFDGSGHVISHLVIEGGTCVGLFGCLESEAEVRNLGVVDVNVAAGINAVGALVGCNFGAVARCYSTGSISGSSQVGGLVGLNYSGNLIACYSTCMVSGSNGIGGLVGKNGTQYRYDRPSGSVTQCYSAGHVSGTGWGAGGLVGSSDGAISQCYSTAVVSGHTVVGGLVGCNYKTVTESYSTGAVTGLDNVGGLTGVLGTAVVCFWDTQTSGQSTSVSGIGKTTAEMQTASTFLEAGWDFIGEIEKGLDDVWGMWDGYDYPRLACEPGPNPPLVFVDVDDPGFSGQMSRYEITNAQYCDFLNAALASGDITLNGADVESAGGLNSGADHVGQRYYRCDGSGYTGYGAINGGAARIRYSEGAFIVDSGFGNHPVTYVSWHGAVAFADYYGYYLPSEDQWQAVADYDGTYVYGCGETMDPAIANYRDSEHPDGTVPVGSFGQRGHGMSDMAGNVWEWTSSGSDSSRIFRGGGWYSGNDDCSVSVRGDGISVRQLLRHWVSGLSLRALAPAPASVTAFEGRTVDDDGLDRGLPAILGDQFQCVFSVLKV